MKMIELRNNVPLTSTKVIEFYTGVKHQNILQLFRRHEKSIEKFGVIMFETWKPKKGSKGGRPETFYFLNEEQFTFFIMLMANSEKVVEFKVELNKQFHQMRKALMQIQLNQQNEEWIKTRKDGKKARKELTDSIKELQKYHAELHPDSTYAKRPDLLYSNITKMIDKALFNIEVTTKSKRNCMSKNQLSCLDTAELSISKKIHESIEQNKDAKETYKILQEAIKPYVDFIGGKSIITEILPSLQLK